MVGIRNVHLKVLESDASAIYKRFLESDIYRQGKISVTVRVSGNSMRPSRKSSAST